MKATEKSGITIDLTIQETKLLQACLHSSLIHVRGLSAVCPSADNLKENVRTLEGIHRKLTKASNELL